MSGRSTNAPRASGCLVARERLELHGTATLADEALLAILVGANGVQAAGALLEAYGTVQQLAHESIGDSTPSVDDITLTERLQQAGSLTGIRASTP